MPVFGRLTRGVRPDKSDKQYRSARRQAELEKRPAGFQGRCRVPSPPASVGRQAVIVRGEGGKLSMNGRIANSTRLPLRLSRAFTRSNRFRTWLLVVACGMSMALLGAVRSQTPAVPLMALSEPKPAEWNEKSDDAPLGALETADEPTLVSAATTPAPGGIPAGFELLRDNAPAPAPVVAAPLLITPRPTLGGAKLRTMLMEVTAYCPCVRCCGPRAQGLTASGRRVSFNGGRFVAADTKLLKFNTKLL